jgi:G3E family GTPase
MQVASYADLLKPIANARELLNASNAKLQNEAPLKALPVQYYQDRPPPDYHHHHHHHHHYYPPPPPPHHHHHHHHHQSGLTVVIPGIGVVRN